jgi:hypothetical protein
MELTRENGTVSGRHPAQTSCQDGFKYRLVQEGDRYRFDSVTMERVVDCQGGSLAEIIEDLEGKFLDEVDLGHLEGLACKNAVGCPREIAQMVRDIRELLVD